MNLARGNEYKSFGVFNFLEVLCNGWHCDSLNYFSAFTSSPSISSQWKKYTSLLFWFWIWPHDFYLMKHWQTRCCRSLKCIYAVRLGALSFCHHHEKSMPGWAHYFLKDNERYLQKSCLAQAVQVRPTSDSPKLHRLNTYLGHWDFVVVCYTAIDN